MLYTLRTNVAPKRAARVPETFMCFTNTLIFAHSMCICRALHVPGIRELEFHQSHNPVNPAEIRLACWINEGPQHPRSEGDHQSA